jgi:hypothetical protein
LISESGVNCVLGTACAPDEYEEGEDCKACNKDTITVTFSQVRREVRVRKMVRLEKWVRLEK